MEKLVRQIQVNEKEKKINVYYESLKEYRFENDIDMEKFLKALELDPNGNPDNIYISTFYGNINLPE
jgi:glycerophosphoryl diester phosphodiesterase